MNLQKLQFTNHKKNPWVVWRGVKQQPSLSRSSPRQQRSCWFDGWVRNLRLSTQRFLQSMMVLIREEADSMKGRHAPRSEVHRELKCKMKNFRFRFTSGGLHSPLQQHAVLNILQIELSGKAWKMRQNGLLNPPALTKAAHLDLWI